MVLVQPFGRDKIFPRPGVACAVWGQVHCEEPAIGPIAGKQGFLIFGWKLGAGAEDHAGGAADAHGHRRGQAVGEILGPLRATLAESLIATAHRMKDANRTVPRRSPIPFHIAVKPEQFSVGVERDVVIVALARGE